VTDNDAAEPADLGPRCGDNGGKTAKGKACPATAKDEDGRCGRHPVENDSVPLTPEELARVAELKASGLMLPPPGMPLPVARQIGEPLHPDKVEWPRAFQHDERLALLNWSGMWMEWLITHWSEVEEAQVKNWLYTILGDAFYATEDGVSPWNPTPQSVGGVLEVLKNHVLLPRDKILAGGCVNPYENPIGRLVGVANGLLDPRTRTLHDFNPGYFNTYSLPLEYDPDAGDPTLWLEKLDEWFAGDKGAILLIRLWFCAVLLGETKHQRSLLLVGPRRSGKGTIRDVLLELLGRSNVATLRWQSLGGDFGLQPLPGKALAVVPDMRLGKGDHSQALEMFLALVGNDHPNVKRKGTTDWEGLLEVMVMILTNEIPAAVRDSSGAFAGRVVIARTRKSFFGKEDKNLIDKLRAELPAILKWALESVEDLERLGLPEPKSSASDREQLNESSSEISVFVEEMCGLDPDRWTEKTALHHTFNSWRRMRGSDRDIPINTFGSMLFAAFGEIENGKRGTAGKDERRVYTGVFLRSGVGSQDDSAEESSNGVGESPEEIAAAMEELL